MNSLPEDPKQPSKENTRPGIRFLQTGILVAGSALLGGLAVALWHRQSLTKLRQPGPAPNSSSAEQDADCD
jgi:hypothetical protein